MTHYLVKKSFTKSNVESFERWMLKWAAESLKDEATYSKFYQQIWRLHSLNALRKMSRFDLMWNYCKLLNGYNCRRCVPRGMGVGNVIHVEEIDTYENLPHRR